MKIKIEIYYLPTNTLCVTGFENVNNIDEYEQLKDLIAEAVVGKLAFLKLSDGTQEQFIGKELLIKSRINLTIIKEDGKN